MKHRLHRTSLLSAVLIGFVMSKLPPRWDMQTLSARLKPLANDPVALGRELQQLRVKERLMVSVYDESGKLLLSNVEPALRPPHLAAPWPPPASLPLDDHAPNLLLPRPGLPPSSADELSHFARRPGGPPDTFAPFEWNGREGLLVARFQHHRPSPVPIVLTMLSGLVVLGIGAFLTARWIARPLLQLSRMATSLGQGDLRARSELGRGDELGEVSRAFDEMAERIQRLLHNEKELLANVAHELRTPLARIRVALEIASEGDTETVRSSLSEIATDLAELETLINDVLTATRFELEDGVAKSSGFALHLQPLTARSIAERSAERFRQGHPDRPFAANFEADADVIDADPVLLRRVLDNLLENAHKYSPDPSSPIALTVAQHGERVCFEIKDQGMGIPTQDLSRVFTAFFRGERSRSRGTGGVGLGLTLAKRIVLAHGGTLEVESSVGTGSTFRAFLPVRAPARPPEPRPESRAQPVS